MVGDFRPEILIGVGTVLFSFLIWMYSFVIDPLLGVSKRVKSMQEDLKKGEREAEKRRAELQVLRSYKDATQKSIKELELELSEMKAAKKRQTMTTTMNNKNVDYDGI